MKYQKFIPDEDGDCIYCVQRSYDCRCSEDTAKMLGYHYTNILAPLPLEEFPPISEKINDIERLNEYLRRSIINNGKLNNVIYVWRKGRKWFKTAEDLVDYFNYLNELENK